MNEKYLIVNKKVLPEYFEKVVEARKLLVEGKVKGVTEAAKVVGISRSTYYKYKDYIFTPSNMETGRKALISMMLEHKKGILSEVLNYLSSINGNIITINQNIPINDSASLVVSLDISEIEFNIEDVIKSLNKIKFVSSARLISVE
nr:ACT domain-containing protein [uncultured Cetobacterium sp.]